jgi:hypothetical protein
VSGRSTSLCSGLCFTLELNWQQTAYRQFSLALARGCRLIQFDKRGTGLSDALIEAHEFCGLGLRAERGPDYGYGVEDRIQGLGAG